MTLNPLLDATMNAWTSIGWQAALILNKLRNERAITQASREEQNPSKKPERAPKRGGKQNPDEERDEIKRRLAELAERQRLIAAGIKGRR
jgi:hypothetical protein